MVGFQLIEALEARDGPATLKELAEAAGMPPGQAHAYLTSFRAIGLVAQDGEGGRYDIGPRALSLGLAALARLDVRDAAREPMRRFRDGTGEAVHLSVWSGQSPVIVSRLDGRHGGSLAIRIGFALPLDRSASGRIFLAFLGEAETLLRRERGDDAARAELAATVAEVRRRGLAVTDGVLNAGFAALSTPVFDHAGEIAAALTTLGAAGHMDLRPEGPTAAALRDAAAAASAALGQGCRPGSRR